MEKYFYHEVNPARIVPKLTSTEILNGIQYGHIMLKPEALMETDKNDYVKNEFFKKLYNYFEQLDLTIISTIREKFDLSVFQTIYKKEIDAGIIPNWEVSRFSEDETLSFILKGVSARSKTTLIKGKFCCQKEHCLYKVSGLESYKERVSGCLDIRGSWGSGCGLRGFIARKNLVQPDIGETDYTVFNWIHSPDIDQEFAVDVVINTINNNAKN